MGPYRFFFYASDGEEPAYVHVEWDDMAAKFWLDPVRLRNSGGFNRNEIRKLHRIVTENNNTLLRAWDEYFSG
jgi:hypothetical protein